MLVNSVIATTSLFNLGTKKIINCAQLRLIDALHPSYPIYHVIHKARDPCLLPVPWVLQKPKLKPKLSYDHKN